MMKNQSFLINGSNWNLQKKQKNVWLLNPKGLGNPN
jgi:hypothetical protein